MLDDARKHYPMTFCLVFDFSGRLEREKFDSAVRHALHEHPMLTARVKRRPWRTPQWIPDAEHTAQLHDHTTKPSSAWIWDAWDITRETGLRIDIRPHQQLLRMSFGFHHSATDGLGGYEFVADLFRQYATACGFVPRRPSKPRRQELLRVRDGITPLPVAPEPAQRELAQAEPARTETLTPENPQASEAAPGLSANAITAEVRRMVLTQPQPVAAVLSRKDKPSVSEPLAHELIDEQTLASLRDLATANNCHLNDVCSAVLFQTLNAWNAQSSLVHRITVPVSLRSRAHRKMSAANCMSYLFLQRSRQECEDLTSLLAGVHWEVQSARRDGWSRIFLIGLGWAQRLPLALRFLMRSSKCMSTIVLSDVGEVARRTMRDLPHEQGKVCMGDLRLERLMGCPPVRPKTRIAVGTMTYAGQLHLAATGCPKTMGKDGTAAFLHAFAARLRAIQADPPSP